MDIRYPSKFEINIDIEDELENITLPRMLIQPILENSILYGVVAEGSSEIKMIHVYADIRDEEVDFVVEDNGCGMTEANCVIFWKRLWNFNRFESGQRNQGGY